MEVISPSMERGSALKSAIHPTIVKIEKTDRKGKAMPVSEFFGSLTFGLAQMREKISKDAYRDLLQTLDHGKTIKTRNSRHNCRSHQRLGGCQRRVRIFAIGFSR